MREFFALVCIISLMLSGCIQQEAEQSVQAEQTKSIKELAIEKCEALCKDALSKGVDLSNGPCLSTANPEWDIEGWVCDIAHKPRIPEIDNLKENQCPEWGVSASSFVEFTPECKFIRAYEGK
ncbi:MAG: hypothetical protein J7L44_01755 [Candidatus Diapherotrites archaeon]|nr:hypothetical protein [Candidatus Diapherotrites archaeon]